MVAVGDNIPLSLSAHLLISSLAGTVNANVVTWLLNCSLHTAGLKHGQSKWLHSSGQISSEILRRQTPEQPSSWQVWPNIWLCFDSYETCWVDDWNYTILLPNLDYGSHPLSFVLQNLFLWLRQSQWVQIQWEESLCSFNGINAHHRLPAAWSYTVLCILLSCWKFGSSFRVTSQWLMKDVQTSK